MAASGLKEDLALELLAAQEHQAKADELWSQRNYALARREAGLAWSASQKALELQAELQAQETREG